MKTLDAKRVLEAALICSSQPMALREMSALFAGEVGNDTLRTLLDELAEECKDRAIELVAVATGWRYQSRAEMAPYLARLDPERPPKYSRAVLETLAIIAYRQPVTRGDIEDIRGVAVASSVVKQLEDRGWIEAIGYREAPGRPALLATTRQVPRRSRPDLARAAADARRRRRRADPAGSRLAGRRIASHSFLCRARGRCRGRAPGPIVPLPMQMLWNRTHECSRRSLVARRSGR